MNERGRTRGQRSGEEAEEAVQSDRRGNNVPNRLKESHTNTLSTEEAATERNEFN